MDHNNVSSWSGHPAQRHHRAKHKAKRAIRYWPVFALLPASVVGVVKSTGFTSIAGADTTVLSVGLVVVVSALSFLRHPRYPVREMLPYFLFALVVLLGVARGDPGEYQMLKTRDFFFLTGVIVCGIPVLVRDIRDLRGLLSMWLAGGTTVALLVLSVGASDLLYERAGINDATLGPAYLSAVAVVAGGAALGERLLPALIVLPAIAVSGVALIMIGSRGPMIGAVVGCAVWVLLRGALRARTVGVVAALTAVAFLGVRMASDVATSRLVLLQDSVRLELWATASTAFAESPVLGLGWGDYVTVSFAQYPHNLFLEAASELGLVGVLSFVGLTIIGARRVWQRRRFGEVRALGAVVGVLLVGGMFSFELTDRIFWIGLIPCLLLPAVMPASAAQGPDHVRT